MNLETFTNPKNLLWCKPSLRKKTLESAWTLTHWLLDDRASILPKMHFWTVWRYSAWKWAKLALACSKRDLQHGSMPFFPLAPHLKTFLLGHPQKSKFRVFGCFSFFSFSYLFAAVINVLSLGLIASSSKTCEKAHPKTDNFYNGVAKCSCRKFCYRFFIQSS